LEARFPARFPDRPGRDHGGRHYSAGDFFGLSGFVHLPLVKVLIWTLGAIVLFYLGSMSIREAPGQD